MIDSQTKQPATGRKLFYGLFVFPLLIAVGMALLLCTVVLMTREVETPETLITDIKTGAPSKRWQKAFELSNELNRDPEMLRSHAVFGEVVHILRNKKEYDEKTRSYMAIALSRFDSELSGKALLETLKDETEAEVQLYLIWGLGERNIVEARETIEGFLQSPREDLLKMAAYVLGVFGDEASVKALTPLLNNESRDVRWNTALSLARIGSDAGFPVILNMLDRATLESQEGLSSEKIEEVMINAIKGASLLQNEKTRSMLEKLSKEDDSLKVRNAAMQAMQQKKES